MVPATMSMTPHCLTCGSIPVATDPMSYPVIPMERPRMPRPAHLTWIDEDSKPSTMEDMWPDARQERGWGKRP